jgi:hypothetical protein
MLKKRSPVIHIIKWTKVELNVKLAFGNLCVWVEAHHWPSLSIADSNLDVVTLKKMFKVPGQEQ